MVKIKIAGILAKEVGFKEIESDIEYTNECFRQLDIAIGSPVAKILMGYNNEGIHYSMVVVRGGERKLADKKPEKLEDGDVVYLSPVNCLHGKNPYLMAGLTFVVGALAITGVGVAVAGGIAAANWAAIGTSIALLAVSTGLSLLAGLLAPKSPTAEGRQGATKKESYLFDGRSRTMAQGSCVPVGYGRMMIPGSVIYNRVQYVRI